MKIYIYGNQSFKKEIHETLDHSNIKFKLDNNTVIEEIESLGKLKTTIENNPKDIYLIDDEKIIKKNSLNKKLKFLIPKDGIEEEYLLDSGVADLAIDSLKELPKYIIKKYEELKLLEPEIEKENKVEEVKSSIELDEELSMLLAKEGENSKNEEFIPLENLDEIFDLDNDADNLDNLISSVENNEEIKDSDDFAQITNFNDDFGLNNISFDYDDDNVLYKEVDENVTSSKNSKIIEELDFLGEEVIEEEEDFSDLEKVNNELFGGFDFLNEEIQEGKKKVEVEVEKEENFEDSDKMEEEVIEEFDFMDAYIKKEEKVSDKETEQALQGDNMNDEFFELDSLNEKDVLEALNYKVEDNSSKSNYTPQVLSAKNETLSIESSNVNDLSLLISKLLNNKTLEITIKIKD